ncbi:hypothetical protein KC316_g8596 [Hortaea werneckii]|nr:hypothetical protein KC324_g3029 [Hortaea werneckii]KAI7581136.1 hypothetical protein KC316_g8596 [Hortaea werneckii]
MAVNYSAPAAQPPPSYASGSDGPEIKGVTAGHWLDSVGLVLTTLFLGLRIYTKTAISRIFGVDDVCMILAWCFAVAIHGLLICIHIWDLTVGEANEEALLVAIASILYAPVMMFAKISLLIFYKKLTPARWMQITVWTVGAFVLAYTVATVLALLFACTPLEKNWNITIQNGQCINKGGIYLFTAAVNALTDLIILGIPVPMVFHLQMSRAQKMGLLIMFVVGSLTCITSIVRLALLPPMVTDTDTSWAVSYPAQWISIEASLVVICGSLPTLRKFFKHFTPDLMGRSSRSRRNASRSSTGSRSRRRGPSELMTFGSMPSRPPKMSGLMPGDDELVDTASSCDGTSERSESQIVPQLRVKGVEA